MIAAALVEDQWAMWQLAKGNVQRSVDERRRVLDLFRRRAGVEPSTANPDDVVRFLVACQNLAPATKASYYSHLNEWFRWLVYHGHRKSNPCDRIPAPKFPRRRPRPISDDQLERLLATRMHRRSRTMILLGAFQGLRVHEIAKIRGEDVDVRDGTLRVIGKGGVDALLPLHPLIAAEAASYPDGYWFPTHHGNELGKTGHILRRSVSDIISNAMTRAGIEGGAHRLRHSYATRLVAADVNIRIVQELMRHASLNTTQIYTAVTLGQQREGLSRLTMPGGG